MIFLIFMVNVSLKIQKKLKPKTKDLNPKKTEGFCALGMWRAPKAVRAKRVRERSEYGSEASTGAKRTPEQARRRVRECKMGKPECPKNQSIYSNMTKII